MSNYAKYKDLGEHTTAENFSSQVSSGANSAPSHATIHPGSRPAQSASSSPVTVITNADHKRHLISNNRVCVVYIWADYCSPCISLIKSGRYEALAQKYKSACLFCKEDVQLAISPDVKGVPMFQFFREGQYAGHVIGANLPEIEEKLKTLL